MVKVNTLDENKLLLFSDIAARVPYNPKMKTYVDIHHVDDLGEETIEHQEENNILIGAIHHDDVFVILNESHNWFDVDEVKLYLRPMSSMTKEEGAERVTILWELEGHIDEDVTYKYQDWLLSHHFDFRNLIGRGLALEAPEGMYNFD